MVMQIITTIVGIGAFVMFGFEVSWLAAVYLYVAIWMNNYDYEKRRRF